MNLNKEEFIDAMVYLGLTLDECEDCWMMVNEAPFKDWKFTDCLPHIARWYGLDIYE